MVAVMTKEWLVKHCKDRGLYQTPYLNDRLYLQCQAICDIENLEEYIGVKLLYLEENCLESMNGIQPLKQLQCLYLRRNFIKSIDYLDKLPFLDTLDISQNYITCLENLSKCLNLRVLVVSHNHLESIESIAHLTICPSIMILDLSHNNLKDGDGILEIIQALSRLAVLYLSGNPCISKMPHYRKKVIANITNLTHLDDRPIFWDERIYAEAWFRGGQDAETAERDRVREMRMEEETKQFESMRRIREQSMEDRLHVVRPNLLQFDPSELGLDEPQTCPSHEDNRELFQYKIDTKQVYSVNISFHSSPGETGLKVGCRCSGEKMETGLREHGTQATLAPQSQLIETPIPSDREEISSIDITTKMQTGFSGQEVEGELENNPLFNDNSTEPQLEVQKMWLKPNPSMFSSDVQSICLPEWDGPDMRTHSYSNVHNNTLFCVTVVPNGDSESKTDENACKPCLTRDDEPHRSQ